MADRIRTAAGASWRLAAILAFVALVVLLPLLVVYRDSRCTATDGARETRWTVRAPFSDEVQPGCRESENGLEVLLDEVGLG